MVENLLIAIPAFIVALGLLIVIHEFGHYWVARKVGVKVLRFSVGFGKPIWRYQRSEDDTEFVVSAIPLGGYVSMLDERVAEVPASQRGQAFNQQKIHHRVAIVAAGPLFNFMFAILAYWMMFVVGLPGLKPVVGDVAANSIAATVDIRVGDQIVAINGEPTATWGAASLGVLASNLDQQTLRMTLLDEWQQSREVELTLPEVGEEFGKQGGLQQLGLTPLRPQIEAVIGRVLDNSPAAAAGLMINDKLLAADGQPMEDWMSWVSYVRDRPGQMISLRVLRDGQEQWLTITPERVEENGVAVGKIGAGVSMLKRTIPDELLAVQKYGPLEAISASFEKTWDMSLMSLQVMGKMLTGQVSLSNLSGPITIAQYAGYSAQGGLPTFLAFLAVISLSLGVLNLLPIPMLDGGHLLYYLIEYVKGSPLSDESQAVGMRIGMFCILMLMSVALYNDLIRIFG
ncbi:MAG: RIP metalloprotease RseP [Gammaproteobacteria bacterium]|nr:RIP metalloprotease RseP [Gammaproteobacteria bacterium]MCF6229822.1 RIP metalloprotease RseP [Gammaproteobacteria bacterium]